MMTGRAAFLGFLIICFITDVSGLMKKPNCPNTEEIVACPLNYDPLCGSDGITYANECTLCMKRQETNKDILIFMKGPCGPA